MGETFIIIITLCSPHKTIITIARMPTKLNESRDKYVIHGAVSYKDI
jgi:hypothetical protein